MSEQENDTSSHGRLKTGEFVTRQSQDGSFEIIVETDEVAAGETNLPDSSREHFANSDANHKTPRLKILGAVGVFAILAGAIIAYASMAPDVRPSEGLNSPTSNGFKPYSGDASAREGAPSDIRQERSNARTVPIIDEDEFDDELHLDLHNSIEDFETEEDFEPEGDVERELMRLYGDGLPKVMRQQAEKVSARGARGARGIADVLSDPNRASRSSGDIRINHSVSDDMQKHLQKNADLIRRRQALPEHLSDFLPPEPEPELYDPEVEDFEEVYIDEEIYLEEELFPDHVDELEDWDELEDFNDEGGF